MIAGYDILAFLRVLTYMISTVKLKLSLIFNSKSHLLDGGVQEVVFLRDNTDDLLQPAVC